LNVSALKVGEKEVTVYQNNNFNVFVLDSGLPVIWLNNLFYGDFRTMIQAASPDFICNGFESCYSDAQACSSTYWENMEYLTFTIDGIDYKIPPEGYTLNYSGGHLCTVMVSAHDYTAT